MAITTTQVQQITDSVANAISAYNAALPVGDATALTAITNGVAGSSGSTLARIVGLNDLSSELALLTPMNTSAAAVTAYNNSLVNMNSFYIQFFPLFNALDNLLGGLNSYITTNFSQVQGVNAWFAAAFNYWVSQAIVGGWRTGATAPTALSAANFFPYASVDPMYTWTVTTGGTISSPTAGSATSSAGGGVAQLYIYKINSGAPSGTGTITITYTNAAGTSAQTTVNNTLVTAGGAANAQSANAVAITGIYAAAVTNVTVNYTTNPSSSENWGLGVRLVRTPGY